MSIWFRPWPRTIILVSVSVEGSRFGKGKNRLGLQLIGQLWAAISGIEHTATRQGLDIKQATRSLHPQNNDQHTPFFTVFFIIFLLVKRLEIKMKFSILFVSITIGQTQQVDNNILISTGRVQHVYRMTSQPVAPGVKIACCNEKCSLVG